MQFVIYTVELPNGRIEIFSEEEREVAVAKAKINRSRVYRELVERKSLELDETFEEQARYEPIESPF